MPKASSRFTASCAMRMPTALEITPRVSNACSSCLRLLLVSFMCLSVGEGKGGVRSEECTNPDVFAGECVRFLCEKVEGGKRFV